MLDKMSDKTLDNLYSQYGNIQGNGMIARFFRWIILKQIHKLEKEKTKEEKTNA